MRKAANNNGYILSSGSTSIVSGGSGTDALVVKVDNDGGMTWARGFRGKGADVPHDVLPTSDGGYLLGIYTGSTNLGVTLNGIAILLIKTDSSGNLGSSGTWAKIYDSPEVSSEYPMYLLEDSANDSYIVAGYTAHTDNDALIFGVNRTTGEITFQKRYGVGKPGDEWFTSVFPAADGGYIIGGYADAIGPANSLRNFLLTKTDLAGNEIWSKVYDEALVDQRIEDMDVTPDGYILGGFTYYTTGVGNYEFFVVKTDFNGTLSWSKVYGDGAQGGSKYEFLYSLHRTSDNGYILGGETKSYGISSPTENWLAIKVGPVGNLCCSPNISRDPQNISETPVDLQDATSTLQAFNATIVAADVGPTGENKIVRSPADTVNTTPVCQ
jgi:hypothetical protein